VLDDIIIGGDDSEVIWQGHAVNETKGIPLGKHRRSALIRTPVSKSCRAILRPVLHCGST